jgi:exodeoxyribonuclease-3
MNEDRLRYKLDFYDAFLDYTNDLRDKGHNLVICGDLNTAHKEIDLARPKDNVDTSGFLPVEREWVTKFLENGYIDTFRMINGDIKDQYTWWSYRTKARTRNVGWRLDYFFVNEEFKDNVKASYIKADVMGSDHCPIALEIEI